MRARGSGGFTLVELLIAVAVVGALSAIAVPALIEVMWRNKVQLAARETAIEMRAARFKAIQEGREYGVLFDFTTDRIVTFQGPAPGTEVRAFNLPTGITFQAPGDGAPEEAGAIVGFNELDPPSDGGYVVFDPDGAGVMVDDTTTEGAVRFAIVRSASPERGLFWEARVFPAAMGRIQIREWNGSDFVE